LISVANRNETICTDRLALFIFTRYFILLRDKLTADKTGIHGFSIKFTEGEIGEMRQVKVQAGIGSQKGGSVK
tara:strand:- start:3 stop:221 length:219 start_codon:yes stop_codon:yes gene_type:complete